MALFNINKVLLLFAISNLALGSAIPKQSPLTTVGENSPLPLIIWHGLGDNFASEEITSVAKLAEATNPGTFTYVIQVEEDAISDRSVTFFGNVTAQIDKVCAELAAHPILSTAPAIDALGFSQGGIFLRSYIERCNNPPIRSLVTFGSPHNGISRFQKCPPKDIPCRIALGFLRFNIWTPFVQSYVVPAQYFRDPSSLREYEDYLETSNLLADINNERELKNETYKSNLSRLQRFAMYVFKDDVTVIPKESCWFAEVNGTSITPLQKRKLYKEDWLGLRTLDEKGALKFETTPGGHMELNDGVLVEAFKKYYGAIDKEFKDDEMRTMEL